MQFTPLPSLGIEEKRKRNKTTVKYHIILVNYPSPHSEVQKKKKTPPHLPTPSKALTVEMER